MEEEDRWDDDEQLMIVEDNLEATSSLRITNPFEPEMVAVTAEGADAPTQRCSTPRSAAAPDLTPQTTEEMPTGDATEHHNSSNGLTIESLKASLEKVLADSRNLEPPTLNSSENLWANIQPPHSINPLVFPSLSEQERTKMMTELIINCISQQKALWDSSDPDFGNSKLCSLLWNNIATVCGMDVKKLRNRWYTLKSTFKKEYVKSRNTGITSKSPNFAMMSFLDKEIQRELKRELNEKNVAVQQFLRKVGNEIQDATQPVEVFEVDEEEDPIALTDEDCMIVYSQQGSAQNLLRSKTTSPTSSGSHINQDDRGEPSPLHIATAQSIKVKDLSELQETSSQKPGSSGKERRPSPEVVCLGEPMEQQKNRKKQHATVPGQHVIRYRPEVSEGPPPPELVIKVEDAMPKNWTDLVEPESLVEVKRCAKKSISKANLKLFPKPDASGNSFNSSSNKMGNGVPWKIENPRSVEVAGPSGKKRMESVKSEVGERSQRDTVITKSEPMEDDDVQIIKEVPGTSGAKGSDDADKLQRKKPRISKGQPMSTKKPSTSTDQPTPPKKPRVSTDQQAPIQKPSPSTIQTMSVNKLRATTGQPQPLQKPGAPTLVESKPSQDPAKRKVDKDRENSADEHFLLSLLCDVEPTTMDSARFRRFKKHSTALVSMILDSKR